jgi:hypothetical protein
MNDGQIYLTILGILLLIVLILLGFAALLS